MKIKTNLIICIKLNETISRVMIEKKTVIKPFGILKKVVIYFYT